MENNACRALEGFVDMLMDAICVVDTEGRYVYVSAACERIFGYTPQELIGTQMLRLVHPDDRQRTVAAAREIMSGQPKLHFENRYLHKNGQVVHIMWSARWSEVDHLRIAVARDITELKRADNLRVSLLQISEAANGCDELPCLFQRIHQVLEALLPARNLSISLYGPRRDVLTFAYHVDEQDDHSSVQALAYEVVRSGEPSLSGADQTPAWLGVPLQTAGGIIGALMVKGTPESPAYTAHDQALLQFVSGQVAAAIERNQLHERLQSMARYDQLTGLANRMLLQERLQGAVEHAQRHGDKLAVLYLDLDKFKQVNDTLGHAAGDALLQEVARRLKASVRSSDTVARIGGDEFVVLLERVQADTDAARVAQTIQSALQVPMQLEGRRWTISSSIGIARYPQDATDLAQLFRHADQAMYRAKRQG
ncbi:GGDEF domain-containing protein [Pseudomonas sp. 3A(2025)]